MRYADVNKKFINLALKQAELERFCTVENWVNDGIDMSTQLFKEITEDLIINNSTANTIWKLGGITVDTSSTGSRFLYIVAQKDRIVPSTCSLPSAYKTKRSQINIYNTGHLGMIINPRHKLAEDIASWIRSNEGSKHN